MCDMSRLTRNDADYVRIGLSPLYGGIELGQEKLLLLNNRARPVGLPVAKQAWDQHQFLMWVQPWAHVVFHHLFQSGKLRRGVFASGTRRVEVDPTKCTGLG